MKAENTRFNSVEELCEVADSRGWDSDLLPLDRSSGDATYACFASERMVLSRFGFSNKVHQRARPLEGFHTFGMLAHAQAPARYSARELCQDSLSYMDHRNGLDAISEPGFVGFTVALHEQLLAELAEQHELASPDSDHWQWNLGPLVSDPESVSHLRRCLQQSFSETSVSAVSADSDALRAFEADLALTILQLGDGGKPQVVVRHPTRQRARRRALDYLRAHRKRPVTVHSLCDVAACSVSTLERAFIDEFGIGPKRYILQERLSDVRRAMLSEPPDRSVTEIASEWGFTHMSKFASDYRRLYGELPSATRRALYAP